MWRPRNGSYFDRESVCSPATSGLVFLPALSLARCLALVTSVQTIFIVARRRSAKKAFRQRRHVSWMFKTNEWRRPRKPESDIKPTSSFLTLENSACPPFAILD